MKTKKYWLLVTICISLLVAFSVKLFAVSWNEKQRLEEYGVSTLKGLEGVRPTILFKKSEKDNKLGSFDTTFWEGEFQMEAELALRRNGIKVLNAGFPALIIFIETCSFDIPEKVYVYAFKVSTYLFEEVQLVRDPKLLTRTLTWPNDPPVIVGRGIIMAGRNRVKQEIKEQVIRQTNEFCNDYLAANPKEPERKPRLVPDDLPEKKVPSFEELRKPKTNK